MKYTLLLFLLISGRSFSNASEYSDSTVIFRVPAPSSMEILKSGNSSPQYLHFTFINTPVVVQEACYYAGIIIESNIEFHRPINISVNWSSELVIPTLGMGQPTRAYIDYSSGTAVAIPVTIYENIHDTEVNGASEPDILLKLNANVDWWYYGLDGNTPADRADLVTTILHEIIHGIAMVSNLIVGDGSVNSTFPSTYDRLIVDSEDDYITDTFIYPNDSPKLFAAITSNNLFLNGNYIVEANTNSPVKIHAPDPYAAGSSLAHFDAYYMSTINGLMTHKINAGTSIHNTGPLLNGLLKDLGWKLVATGIDDMYFEDDIKLYPNPSSEDVFVSGLTSMVDISMYDVAGQKVLEVKQYSNKNSIDISLLNKGIYLVKVAFPDNKRVIVLKLQKD